MRIAAEQGLDGISLTNAAAQIERNRGGFANVFDEMTSTFGKSETGKDVTTVFLSQEGNVKTRLTVDPKTGEVTGASQQDSVGMQLSEVIDSRETAQQLLDKEGTIPVSQRVVGKDGYKTVYDKKLPSKMRKIINRMQLDEGVDVSRADITVGGRAKFPEFTDIDDEFEPDLFEEIIEEFEDVVESGPELMLSSMVARNGMGIYGFDGRKFNEFMAQRYGLEDMPFEDLDNDVVLATYEDVFEAGIQYLTDRDRSRMAIDLQRYFPSKFADITDAEDYVDRALVQRAPSLDPARNFGEWIAETKMQAGDPITVKDNHTVIFTEEMRKKIMEQGLPRLRKGGLVSPK